MDPRKKFSVRVRGPHAELIPALETVGSLGHVAQGGQRPQIADLPTVIVYRADSAQMTINAQAANFFSPPRAISWPSLRTRSPSRQILGRFTPKADRLV